MIKRIIFLVIVLLLIGGGFFYWWQNQADVRELNKGFPEWAKITKDWKGNYHLIYETNGGAIEMIKIMKEGDRYRAINERYGYKFLLPPDREGLWRIEYLEQEGEEMEYVCQICEKGSILYVGLIGGKGDNMTLESYKLKDQNMTLDDFAKKGNPTWLYKMDVEKTKINNIETIIASREYGREQERDRFYNYFFKGESNFYKLEHVSKEFIDYLILNGKW